MRILRILRRNKRADREVYYVLVVLWLVVRKLLDGKCALNFDLFWTKVVLPKLNSIHKISIKFILILKIYINYVARVVLLQNIKAENQHFSEEKKTKNHHDSAVFFFFVTHKIKNSLSVLFAPIMRCR